MENPGKSKTAHRAHKLTGPSEKIEVHRGDWDSIKGTQVPGSALVSIKAQSLSPRIGWGGRERDEKRESKRKERNRTD